MRLITYVYQSKHEGNVIKISHMERVHLMMISVKPSWNSASSDYVLTHIDNFLPISVLDWTHSIHVIVNNCLLKSTPDSWFQPTSYGPGITLSTHQSSHLFLEWNNDIKLNTHCKTIESRSCNGLSVLFCSHCLPKKIEILLKKTTINFDKVSSLEKNCFNVLPYTMQVSL